MKKLLASKTAIALLLSLFSAAQALAQSLNLAAAADPRNGTLTIVDDGTVYLEFDYYDWGPDWSGVKRSQKTSPKNNGIAFTYDQTVQKTKTAFTVAGIWVQAAPSAFQFQADLKTSVATKIQLAQFSLSVGDMFDGAPIAVSHVDGSTSTIAFPLKKGPIGKAVTAIALTDRNGAVSKIAFKNPTEVSGDGTARFILAEGELDPQKTYSLAFTLTLPAETKFFSGPASVPNSTAGWYPFKGDSPIPAKSEWNLASWIEAPAGKHGRITREADRLIYNGKPIKLWGTNISYGNCAPDAALADRRADFYAAMGINAVRLHKYADGSGWAGIASRETATELDPAKLDQMDYFVAALKKRGIYVKLSPVFMVKLGPGDESRVPYMHELGEMKNDRLNPRHGSFFIGKELQDVLIQQVTSTLKHRNPYTGFTYAEDPAVAYVEIYNEDCALFGGVGQIIAKSPTLRERTGKRFAEWLKKKYTDEATFLAAWGEAALNCSILKEAKIPLDESWAEQRIYPAGNPWFFDPTQLEGSQKPFRRRLLDTMAFLFELQTEVYARCAAAIRATGYTGEIITSNWQAGRGTSHFYNLYSDRVHGTIDRHNYFGGSRGEKFLINNDSMLSIVGGGSLSASLQQVEDRPFMLSEWIHVYPNEWTVEGAAIISAYGVGLQGWDVSFPFQNGDEGTFAKAMGLQAWDVVAPSFIGIFPAVSRQVLRGDVRESDIVHTRNVHLPSLDDVKIGFDEKVLQQWDIKTFDSDVFPAAALAAAKGVVRFTDTFTPTSTFDLTPYRDGDDVISSTGQLRWHGGKTERDGHIVINTPGTQAVVGFAKGRTFELGDVTIRPTSHYGAIYVSARDKDATIGSSKAVLVSAIARARNAGSSIANDVFMFSDGNSKNKKGSGPVLMEPVAFTLDLKRTNKPTVHILDHNGVKTGKTVPIKNNTVTIDTGRDATPYYLIEY